MRNHHVIAATVAATMLAFAAPAVAGPITYNQAMSAASAADAETPTVVQATAETKRVAKRSLRTWPAATKAKITRVLCRDRPDRGDERPGLRCGYAISGHIEHPTDGNPSPAQRTCSYQTLVTLVDGKTRASKPTKSCGNVRQS